MRLVFRGTIWGVVIAVAALLAVAAEAATGAVLHDQLTPTGNQTVSSQNDEPSLDAYDSLAVDDFLVPNGAVWRIDQMEVSGDSSGSVKATTANLFLFGDAGALPGSQLFSHPSLPLGAGPTYPDLSVPVPALPALGPGHYWIGIQVNLTFLPEANNWWWRDRAPQFAQPAAWRQPGDGFGDGCTSFVTRHTCPSYPDSADTPDQAFRLSGTESRLGLVSAKAKSAKKVKLTVDVPIAGGVTVTGSKLKAKTVQATQQGPISFAVKTKRAARRKLGNGKRVKTTIELSMTPLLGQPLVLDDQRKLKLKRRR